AHVRPDLFQLMVSLMRNDESGASDPNEQAPGNSSEAPGAELNRRAARPGPLGAGPEPRRLARREFEGMSARPASRRERDEDEDDEEEEEKPKARKKRSADDDEEDEKPRKKSGKAAANDRKRMAEEEEEEEDTLERKVPRKGTRRYQLYMVVIGLSVFRASVLSLLAVGFYASLRVAVFELQRVDAGGTMSWAAGILLYIVLAAMPLPFLVAEGLFLMTPPRSDARGSVIAAMALHVLTIVICIACLLSG